MGLFASFSTIIDRDDHAVAEVLQEYADLCEGSLKAQTSGSDVLQLTASVRHTTALFPTSVAWEDAARFLSQQLRTSVLSFHIHDGCLWMFLLFRNGTRVLQFNPLPDYWENLPDAERSSWLPETNEFLEAAGLTAADPADVQAYLGWWSQGDTLVNRKVRSGDRYSTADGRQVFDFMNCLQLPLPAMHGGSETAVQTWSMDVCTTLYE